MTPHDLLANFKTLAEAPNCIQRLRELVLELAVRGKLVEQDPGDVPADELLKAIKAEKFRFIASGGIRGGRQLPEIDQEETPFELPATWRWSRLRTISRDLGQKIPDAPFSYIDVGSIDNQRGQIAEFPEVLDPAAAPSRARKLVSLGTVIFSTVRPYLMNIAIVAKGYDPAPIVSTAFAVLHPFQGINSTFLFWVLRSPFFMSWVADRAKGVAYPAISDGDLQMAPVPVPPVGEQRRIVARVDELMALLDHLQAKRQEREAACTAARDSALATLRVACTPEEVEIAWLRIQEQFRELFHSPETLPPLRQAILNLAIKGVLLRQDLEDDSAAKILVSIRSENFQPKAHAKNAEALSKIDNCEEPFPLPPSWKCMVAGDLCRPMNTITYGVLKPVWVKEGVPTVRVQDMQGGEIILDGIGQCSPERVDKFLKTRLETGDLLIAKDGATLGKTAFVPASLEGGNITQHVLRFPINRHMNSHFVRLVIDSPHGQAWMKSETKGVALPGVNVGDFRRMPVPIPPLAEQSRIVAKVDHLISMITSLSDGLRIANEVQNSFASASAHHLEF